MNENEIVEFIRKCIGSVYALELLLLIMRHTTRRWRIDDLVRELRSSKTAVSDALGRLIRAGLIAENPEQAVYAFAPVSERQAQIAVEIERLYATTPVSVMKAIVNPPQRSSGA